jgi:UDPglucose 6-dehydrogenase
VLAARLQAEGAHVQAFDPIAEAQARTLVPELDYASSALEAVAGCDAAVLVTEWPEFIALDWREVRAAMRGNLIVDGRNALDPEEIEAAGLVYEGIGRRPRSAKGGGTAQQSPTLAPAPAPSTPEGARASADSAASAMSARVLSSGTPSAHRARVSSPGASATVGIVGAGVKRCRP